MPVKRRSLGRNLEALLGKGEAPAETVTETRQAKSKRVGTEDQGGYRLISVERLQPGTYQPRRDMDQEALNALAASIKAQGVIQPLVIRLIDAKNKRYEIIAGERRWRAAQLAGLTEVPVIERSLSNEEAMAVALIENIQREDLNPLEEAMALERLMQEFELSHGEIAKVIGRSRSSISNLLRLLTLAEPVKRLLERGDLDMGHARALLALPSELQTEVADELIEKHLSVRETEALVKTLLEESPTTTDHVVQRNIDPDVLRLQDKLSNALHTLVQVKHRPNGKGKFVVKYNSIQELERLLKCFDTTA